MTVKLLTKHRLEFLSLKGGCTGLFESTFVKMPHCWKSHYVALLVYTCMLVLHRVDTVGIFIFVGVNSMLYFVSVIEGTGLNLT